MKKTTDFNYIDNIPCNTGVNLQILTATHPIRLKTRLIGIDPNMSVILAMNNDQDWLSAKNFIREGQGAIVRMVNRDEPEANIVAFRTHVQKIMSICGRWLVLDYPKQLQKVALRNYSRISIHVECVIIDEKSQSELSRGYLHDISINGCAFIGELIKGCTVESRYQLQVKFAEIQFSMLVPITVKNIKYEYINTVKKQYGLVFDANNQETQDFIQQVILYHLSNNANYVQIADTQSF